MLWTFVLTCVLLLGGCFRTTGRCNADSDCASGFACDVAFNVCVSGGPLSGFGSDGGSPPDGGPDPVDAALPPCTPDKLPTAPFQTQAAPGPYKQFGTAIAADDSVVAMGAPLSTTAGTVQLFTHEAGSLSAIALYRPSQTVPYADDFGAAVSLSGDTLFIGAPKSGLSSAGAVYVVTRGANNIWPDGSSALQPLYGSPTMGERLGAAVSVSGDTAFVGAPNGNGSVAVVQRDQNNQWNVLSNRMTAPVDPTGSLYGTAVAVHKNRAVVGAPGSKAVYFYVREGQWVYTSALRPDPGSTDTTDTFFGAAVALMDDTLVIGAPPVNNGSKAAVYFCSISAKDVNCKRFAPPPLSAPPDALRFGGSVALYAATNLALVGASAYNPFSTTPPSNPGIGTVYGYTRTGDTWNYKTTWMDGADGDMYGRSLAVSRSRFFIGMPNNGGGYVNAFSYMCQ